jgi:hypothetical protein
VSPLPADGWRILQSMLPDIGACVHDAPSDCKVLLGDAMRVFSERTQNTQLQRVHKCC